MRDESWLIRRNETFPRVEKDLSAFPFPRIITTGSRSCPTKGASKGSDTKNRPHGSTSAPPQSTRPPRSDGAIIPLASSGVCWRWR